ncbi:hypothetical protein CI109_101080 [Kwoniella shandongensis]|uniref:Uncharacterized protein n=1 Tax=Kwoniella shandongensis TaxID=1734106 RepID=A0AAJ8LFY5_9TREE
MAPTVPSTNSTTSSRSGTSASSAGILNGGKYKCGKPTEPSRWLSPVPKYAGQFVPRRSPSPKTDTRDPSQPSVARLTMVIFNVFIASNSLSVTHYLWTMPSSSDTTSNSTNRSGRGPRSHRTANSDSEKTTESSSSMIKLSEGNLNLPRGAQYCDKTSTEATRWGSSVPLNDEQYTGPKHTEQKDRKTRKQLEGRLFDGVMDTLISSSTATSEEWDGRASEESIE